MTIAWAMAEVGLAGTVPPTRWASSPGSSGQFSSRDRTAPKWGSRPRRSQAESVALAELPTVVVQQAPWASPGAGPAGPRQPRALTPCSPTSAADVPKALVLLDPPWASVLKDDHVTLKCQGLHPAGDNTTQWLHNGSLLSSQAPAYTITAARAEDGGEYRCQTGLSSLSDPVQLHVHLGWLVLQAPRWVFQEGEPIQLRCHSWKNNKLHKVTYLQNGRGLRYFHQNSDLHIPEATRNHSGSYFCRGLIGHHNMSSETVTITVQGPANPVISSSVLPWHQIAFCLVMGLLLAADTGLYFSVQRDLRSSQRARKEHTLGWSLGSQDK